MELINIYENDSESEGVQSSESDLEVPFVDKNSIVNWDGIEDRDCYITIKTVPDKFVVAPTSSSDLRGDAYTLYFYRLQVETTTDQILATAGAAAEELMNCVATINSIGIALRSELTAEVVDTISELYLLDVTLSLKIVSLGSESVPFAHIAQLQRFHHAVYGQEDSSAFQISEYLNLDFDFFANADHRVHVTPFEFMPDDKWTTSSNGSWFVVYPIEHSAMDTTALETVHRYDLEYVKKCANEAQVLIHNLRVTGQADTTVAKNIPIEQSCGALARDRWDGLVILANDMSLCFVAADRPSNRKTLNSVMKRVKVSTPQAPAAVVMTADTGSNTVDAATAATETVEASDASSVTYSGGSDAEIDNPSIVFSTSTKVVTYAEHLKAKRPHLAEIIEQHMQDPTHRLIASNQISTKATHTLMLTTISDQIKCSSEWARRNSVFRPKVERLHFLAEQCRPMGKLKWFHMSRLLPSVMYRVVSLELAVDCRALMKSKIEAVKAQPPTPSPSPQQSRPGTPQAELAPDQIIRDRIALEEPDYATVPRICTMLEAMTPKMAIEHLDSERLETLGDAFLKYAISSELFKLWPDMREGKLTSLRSTFITNRKLCKVAFDSGIVPFIRALPLSRGERVVTICPPGMCAASELLERSIWGMDIMKYPAEKKYYVDNMFKYPVRQHHRHVIMYKKLSDMVEAIIGAYYIDGGEAAAVATIKAFGIWPKVPPNLPVKATPVVVSPVPVPPVFSAPSPVKGAPCSTFHARFGGLPVFSAKPAAAIGVDAYNSPVAYRKRSHSGADEPLAPLPSQIVSPITGITEGAVQSAASRVTPDLLDFDELEARINYKFKDRSLLSLALTHTSVNRFLNGERLEFLGDAVLDFVVVSHWFKRNSAYEPCQLHDVKSKNSCNRNLALKAFNLGLHRFLQHKSEGLQAQLDEYCASHTASIETPSRPTALQKGVESSSKVLADTFEALIGAIFLDCGEDIRSIEKFAAENNLFVGVL